MRMLSEFKILLHRIITLLVVHLISIGISASDNRFAPLKFERVDINNASVSVRCILQDEKGFIWFGTDREGLFRYDGIHFDNYMSDIFNEYSLKDNTVLHLMEDSKNRIWISTYYGVGIYNPLLDEIQTIFPKNSDGKEFDIPISLTTFEDSKGRYWVMLRNDISCVTETAPSQFEFVTYSFEEALHPSRFTPYNDIFEGHDGRIWVTSPKGLFYFDEPGDTFRYFYNEALEGKSLHTMLPIDETTQWLSSSSFLFALSWADTVSFPVVTHLTAGNTDKDYFTGNFSAPSCWNLAKDHQGNYWVTSSSGVTFLQPDVQKQGRMKAIPYYSNPFDAESIINNWVYAPMVDAEGSVWLATSEGLSKFNYKSNLLQVFHPNPYIENGLPGGMISAFAEAGSGFIWIVSQEKGLVLFNRNTYRFYQVPQHVIPASYMTSVQVDANGMIWLGMYGSTSGGVYKLALPKNFYSRLNFDVIKVTRYIYSDVLAKSTNL